MNEKDKAFFAYFRKLREKKNRALNEKKDLEWFVDLKWWEIMPDDYSKHLEKRIKEMRERMIKSKLDGARQRKHRNNRFNKEVE